MMEAPLRMDHEEEKGVVRRTKYDGGDWIVDL